MATVGKISDTQLVVLRALAAGCREMPLTSAEVGSSRLCKPLTKGRHCGAWAGTHLRALAKKGLVYTDAPGAAKGYWSPTDEGYRALTDAIKD